MTRKRKTLTRNPDARQRTSWIARHAAFLTVLAVMLVLAFIRLRVADVPLERDEGEYAYSGQLILQGLPPFQLAYNMKFPGVYYAYAAILAIFGQTAWGVHAGLVVVNLATIAILFFLALRLLRDPLAAAVTAIAYGTLTVDRWSLAIFGHATHFVVLAAMSGLLLLFRAIDSKSRNQFVSAGVLLGVSILMKQNGVFFFALGLGLAAYYGTLSRTALVAAGAAIPMAIVLVVLFAQGVFDNFWFWTIHYGSQYASSVPLSDAWTTFTLNFSALSEATMPLWLLAAAGLVLFFVVRWPAQTRVIVTVFLLVSALAICPGLYFRQHYFILLFPAVALFCGIAVVSVQRLVAFMLPDSAARVAAVGLFLVAVGLYARTEWDYLFSISAHDLSRSVHGANPFVESPELARYLQAHTSPDDRIAVLGSEPQIYFYANRRSATGYIYTYPLMEEQKYSAQMQDEMIAEITAAHPKYLVFVTVRTSWAARDPKARILTWSSAYLRKCYRAVGIADILPGETQWRWDEQVIGYRPQSQAVLYTYARNSDAPCSVFD